MLDQSQHLSESTYCYLPMHKWAWHWAQLGMQSTCLRYNNGDRKPLTVLRRPCLLFTISEPVQKSKKAPVPYVHLASPFFRHLLPIKAPCWSPTRPPIGTPASAPYAMCPHTSDVETSLGRTEGRTSKNSSNDGSHLKVAVFNKSVREAFVTSEMCTSFLTPPRRFL